jgi:serine/threonine-protein kinase
VLGGYTIVKALHADASGDLYLAEHRLIHRSAAIQVLSSRAVTDAAVDRFFVEARALAAMRQPGLVKIHDADLDEGRLYIVMELLEGQDLAAVIARAGNLASESRAVAALARDLAETLAETHARGILHGDLRLDNVFLHLGSRRGGGERTVMAKLLNFGVAALLGQRPAAAFDQRTDVHALGCLLFELVTGQPPFALDGAPDARAPAASSIQPGVPRDLDRLMAEMLAPASGERTLSMREVAARLEAAVGPERPVRTTKLLANGEALVVAPAVKPPEDLAAPASGDATAAASDLLAPGAPPELFDPSPAAAPAPASSAARTLLIRERPTWADRPLRSAPARSPALRPRDPPASARRMPWKWIVPSMAVALVAATVAALVASSGSATAPRRRAVPAVEVALEAPPPPALPAPPSPATVVIEVVSHPDGAEALVADEHVPRGRTPLLLRLPRSRAAVELRLKADGYLDRTVALDVAADHTVEIALERMPAPAPPPAPPRRPARDNSRATRDTREHSHKRPRYYMIGD